MRSNLGYYWKEGFRSFWADKIMSLSSLIIVTACLLAFGVYIIFSINLSGMSAQIQGQYEINVYTSMDTPRERTFEIENEIQRIINVEKVDFVSREERFSEVIKLEWGGGLDEINPLRDQYKVTLKDLGKTDETVSAIKKIHEVQDVKLNAGLAYTILRFTQAVNWISIILIGFMALVSIFIIANTIKITVFARRKDINVMKFVGATDWFIRWPFIIEGVIIGAFGAIVAYSTVIYAYSELVKVMNQDIINIVQLAPFNQVAFLSAFAIIGAGILLGAVGSAISVRKHLRV